MDIKEKKEKIESLLKEFNNIQYAPMPCFMYDIKNMNIMSEGYWATDCISKNLSVSTIELHTIEELRDELNNYIKIIVFENPDIVFENLDYISDKFKLKFIGITSEMRKNALQANKKDSSQKINIIYISEDKTHIENSKKIQSPSWNNNPNIIQWR